MINKTLESHTFTLEHEVAMFVFLLTDAVKFLVHLAELLGA